MTEIFQKHMETCGILQDYIGAWMNLNLSNKSGNSTFVCISFAKDKKKDNNRELSIFATWNIFYVIITLFHLQFNLAFLCFFVKVSRVYTLYESYDK